MSQNSPSLPQPDVGVLVPAGGQGTRAGEGIPKQYREVGGVPMLLRTLRPFMTHPRVHQVVVALPKRDCESPPLWLAELVGERLHVVEGGSSRRDSVRAALVDLDTTCTAVLVHDAARPFVSVAEIDAVLQAVDGGTGAVAALPVADTLKRANTSGHITETVARDGVWRALTPQGFPREMLENAYRVAGDHAVTDDAGLVQAAGGTVVVVEGQPGNIKLTTAADFAAAESFVTR